ncbi:uncharacterized protein LOC131144602 isoform X2 [Malania oleifera]|uniref:uncharacterized protein LOC131144602 isoform X2 n=1 Tax=Malania oleifera TaxID=397392 RepID=UPI0025ADB42F|nr:uncharacterized protein LOC131144602 isoform X2 [Malania oleifera]
MEEISKTRWIAILGINMFLSGKKLEKLGQNHLRSLREAIEQIAVWCIIAVGQSAMWCVVAVRQIAVWCRCCWADCSVVSSPPTGRSGMLQCGAAVDGQNRCVVSSPLMGRIARCGVVAAGHHYFSNAHSIPPSSPPNPSFSKKNLVCPISLFLIHLIRPISKEDDWDCI